MAAIGYQRPAATIYDFIDPVRVWEQPASSPAPSSTIPYTPPSVNIFDIFRRTPAPALPTSAGGGTSDPGGCSDCIAQATGGRPAPVANVTQQLPPDLGAARPTGSPELSMAAAMAPSTALAAVSSWWWLVLLLIVAVVVYVAKR